MGRTVNRLRDVRPRFSLYHIADSWSTDAIFTGKISLAGSSSSTPTDVANCLLCQLRLPLRLTLRTRRLSEEISSFGHHVAGVIRVRSEEEVFGADTVANVTDVANEHPMRNWAIREFPGDSVWERVAPLQGEIAVTIPVAADSARPEPTRVTAIDLRPEPFFGGHKMTLPANRDGAYASGAERAMDRVRHGQRSRSNRMRKHHQYNRSAAEAAYQGGGR